MVVGRATRITRRRDPACCAPQAEEIGRPERGGTFIPLQLSRQEIADLAGTTIETAIRVMSRWGKQGWVETAEDGFVILRREPLERLAGT